jgi:hypothetical protein
MTSSTDGGWGWWKDGDSDHWMPDCLHALGDDFSPARCWPHCPRPAILTQVN